MLSLVSISLISLCLASLSCLITYETLRKVWVTMPKLAIAPRARVGLMMLPIFACHIASIWLFAAAYFILENCTGFGRLIGQNHRIGLDYQNAVDCLYFSAATYTSLGFGDILPSRDLRMLSSAEALSGLMMIGWTISFTYLAMERFWKMPGRKR